MFSFAIINGAEHSVEVQDIDKAKEICQELPLEPVEGIWLYPEDEVTVLILADHSEDAKTMVPVYSITIVETTDARLKPGERIGTLKGTAEEGVFAIELATEKKNDLFLKPKTCLATLGKNEDTFLFKKEKSNLRGRLNLNLNRLLPGFWKIISGGISVSSESGASIPTGMIKIYPSYDGNGSSRRKIIYL